MTTPAAVAAGQAAKDKGNAAFKAGDFADAVGHYSAAMRADARNPTFPLNRAAAYLRLGKNEDAERDCGAVLSLDPRSVKALFRRAQARAALQKLADAQADLEHAFRLEPTNEEVKRELKRIDEALQEQKRKKPLRTKPAEVPTVPSAKPTPTKSASTPAKPPAAPKRRRVPIEIVEPQPTTSTAPPAPGPSTSELLTPRSSRMLSASPPPPAPAAAPSPTPKPLGTFQAAKEARAGGPMGGIFRPDGRHTLFGAPAQKQAKEKAKEETKASPPPAPAPAVVPTPAAVQTPAKSPMTLFAFTRRWDAQKTAEDRWALLNEIPPAALPALFQASLESAMLAGLLGTFRDVLVRGVAQPAQVRAYLLSVARVPRFSTVVLFMGREERAVIGEVWGLVGDAVAEEERERRAWGVS